MTTQKERAQIFKKLHIKGEPLIIFNIWDAGSARALQEIGARAIATGSWSVAAAHGFQDGENLPFQLAVSNLERIVATVDLPVSIDLEGGYGESPAELENSITKIIQAGAVGINFEDQIVKGDGLYSVEKQCERIKAIREIATRNSIPLFINARTDIYLQADRESHSDRHLEESLRRAEAYSEAGADGFFVPGLRNPQHIQRICDALKMPVNIMVLPDTPSLKDLAKLGVGRISFGPIPYRLAMEALQIAGRKALSMSE